MARSERVERAGRRSGRTPDRQVQPTADLQRRAGNRAVAGLLASGPVIVQRFQAGEHGHGGIEEEALRAAGLTGTMGSDEIGGIYLGNWMRDFSQVGDPHSTAVLTLLNVLSMGEFNRPVTAEQLGGYLPSEHLDNPRGGTSPEAPGAAPGVGEESLSTSQMAWLTEERMAAFQAQMRERSARTHLPTYIEAGKERARRELARAARAGRGRPDGLLAMGGALHAVEDYFAHSNFTDAAVYMLVADGTIPATSPVHQGLVARAGRFGYDPSGGVAGGARRPEIMTGTYRKTGNERVSLLEQLRSEIETGALRKAAVLGAIRVGMVNAGAMGGDAGAAVGAGAVGGLAAAGGAMVEGAGGAAAGAAAGWRGGSGWGAIWGALGGAAEGLVKGTGRGIDEGWRGGSAAGAAGGRAVGSAVGAGVGAGLEAVAIGGVVALVSAAIGAVGAVPRASAAADAAVESAADRATDAATANDRAQGDSAPNHSQLAKDDTEHPAFAGARALAVHVDTEIARAMQVAWAKNADADSVAALTALVDRFVSNPADNPWWRGPLTASLAR